MRKGPASSMAFEARRANARVQLLMLACASSAGVHAVLAPAHFHEAQGLGLGFAAAAVALAAVTVGLERRSWTGVAACGAALLLAALIAAYVATRITSLPLLAEHSEPLAPVGVGTKLTEALGLFLAAMSINEMGANDHSPLSAAEKGVPS
jgi:hypothetical protein